jgi:hypothetical protein
MLNHPYDGYDKFEHISELVKKNTLRFKDPKSDIEINKGTQLNRDQQLEDFIQANKLLLCEKLNIKEEHKVFVTRSKCALPDLVRENDMFEWAGVSFGEDQIWRIQKSMKRLAHISGASSLRFWGKLYASKSDYFVIEGLLLLAEESENKAGMEARGEGVNALVYWVSDNLLDDWQ